MPGITGANSLDFLKGPLVAFDYGAWVTAGGAVTYKYGGWLDTDLEIEFIRETAKIEPGNSTYPVDAYFTKSGLAVRGTLMEASLRKLQAVLGGAEADVLVATSFASETFGIALVEAQACGVPVTSIFSMYLMFACVVEAIGVILISSIGGISHGLVEFQ
jgi:glycosyltransferase involved in cell wall biosynthesis